jgi:hypothetical protein
MPTTFHLQTYSRLEPATEWRGGRITPIDVLELDEAAAFASKHAGTEITVKDILRAAARGEITLRAIVHCEARLRKHDGGIYCNLGTPNENKFPAGCILNLPRKACEQLANAGRASWRTFDGVRMKDGIMMRFDEAMLEEGEPDIETVTADCRILGDAVHALADAFIDRAQIESSPASGNGDALQKVGTGETAGKARVWTSELIAELKRDVDAYGQRPTAKKWGMSHTNVQQVLKRAEKPPVKKTMWSGL